MRSLRQSNRQYFEAIIQLRPDNNELISFVKNLIGKKEGVYITNEIHKKYGSDLYITSRKFATFLGKKLKKAFKGELITSRTLYSMDRQTSKGIYRVTICFRMEEPEE